MVNKTKILSDLSKMAVDMAGAFSTVKKEVNTIVRLRIDKTINNMKLVKRDEFEILKKMVQKLVIENDKLKKTNKKSKTPIRKKKKSRKKRKIT
jgi:BMFP domain-containing protein YqiC